MATESQKNSQRLCESLPVRVTASDVEKFPQFASLLSALSKHIGADGTSTVSKKDLDDAGAKLKAEKGRWLEQHVLYTEVQELVLDNQAKRGGSASGSASSGRGFYDAVSEMLTLTEVKDYLECHPDPGSDVTLLGLTKEDVDRNNPHKRHLQSIQQKLIPEVEACLRKKCETLVNFHDCCGTHTANTTMSQDNGDKLTFAKASQLPSVLESEHFTLSDERKQLKAAKIARESQLSQYLRTLVNSLALLETLITKHRLRSQSEHDRISSEWLTARCDAMCLKIKTIQLQILCDTYYTDTVQALTKVKQHLDKAVADTEADLYKATESLKAYESVGMGFSELVEEYTHLQQELDNRRWTLRELKLTSPEDDAFL